MEALVYNIKFGFILWITFFFKSGWIEKGSKKGVKGKEKQPENQNQSSRGHTPAQNGHNNANAIQNSQTLFKPPIAQNAGAQASNIQASSGRGRGRGRGTLNLQQQAIEKKKLPATQTPLTHIQSPWIQNIAPLAQNPVPLIQDQLHEEPPQQAQSSSLIPEVKSNSSDLDIVASKKLEKFEEFPKKPTERCKIGRETTFRTNHFLIEFSKLEFDFDNLITQYDVTITETIYDTKGKNPTVKVVESASIGL